MSTASPVKQHDEEIKHIESETASTAFINVPSEGKTGSAINRKLEVCDDFCACPMALPVGPIPVDPTPVDPTPVDHTPVDPTPVDPTPVDPTPVDLTPVDPIPVAKFFEHVDRMHAKQNNGFREQFEVCYHGNNHWPL